MTTPTLDAMAWFRSTFTPGEPLPEWLVDRDNLERSRQLVDRLQSARNAATNTPRVRRRRRVSALHESPPAARRSPTTTSDTVRTSGQLTGVNTTSSGPVRLFGYAAMWDRLSVPLGGFKEKIRRGAFAATLSDVAAGNHSVLAYLEHDHRLLLGRTGVNLELREDAKGLRFELTLPDTTHANDAAELVRKSVLRGMSFGFIKRADSWDRSGGESIRTLTDVALLEVSVVGSPAYPATAVQATRSWPRDIAWRAVLLRALSNRPARSERLSWSSTRAATSLGEMERR
jgi:HK97 family phage prohead protease